MKFSLKTCLQKWFSLVNVNEQLNTLNVSQQGRRTQLEQTGKLKACKTKLSQ